MGLKEVLHGAAKAAVAAVGNIGVSANYLSLATATYDTSAGAPTTSFSTVAGVTVIFQDFRVSEIGASGPDRLIKPDDRKALLPATLISGVVPSVGDQVVVDTSVTWQVVRASKDPAEALHALQVRRP